MKPTYTAIPVPPESSLSEAIVLGIAKQKEMCPTEMPPLYETINPEAVDTLFNAPDSGHLTFEYAGHNVVIPGREPILISRIGGRTHRPQDKEAHDKSLLQITCSVCDWEATATGTDDHTDVSRRAIDHFMTTDHTPVGKVGEISV